MAHAVTADPTGKSNRRRTGKSNCRGSPAIQPNAFREVLSEQSIAVLVGSTLPRAMRIKEVDIQVRIDAQLDVLSEFSAAIPSETAREGAHVAALPCPAHLGLMRSNFQRIRNSYIDTDLYRRYSM